MNAIVKFYNPHTDRYTSAVVENVVGDTVFLVRRERVSKYRFIENRFTHTIDELLHWRSAKNLDNISKLLVVLRGFSNILKNIENC